MLFIIKEKEMIDRADEAWKLEDVIHEIKAMKKGVDSQFKKQAVEMKKIKTLAAANTVYDDYGSENDSEVNVIF